MPVSAAPAPVSTITSESTEATYNRILDNSARELYAPLIGLMYELVPQDMQGKIPRANVQQAFVIDTVAKLSAAKANPRILCVGSLGDTAASTLKALRYHIEEIDPLVNYDLHSYCELASTEPGSYDIVFATSVIEHVKDDEQFVADIQRLLAPNGYGIITCDYDDRWKFGMPIPESNVRMYNKRDLGERLPAVLSKCRLVGSSAWDCAHPDFTIGTFNYTFATMVFQRRNR